MSLPTIVPTGFAGDYTDFLKVKADKSGAVRNVQNSVSVPATTATDTIIGLFPFNAGFRFSGLGGYNLYSADLDSSTNVTVDFGVAYQDTVQGTDDLDLITSASTAPQAGGFVAPDEIDWMTFTATGNGWVTAQVNAATTTTGSLTFNIPGCYDTPANGLA